jgi:hypothetical protein
MTTYRSQPLVIRGGELEKLKNLLGFSLQGRITPAAVVERVEQLRAIVIDACERELCSPPVGLFRQRHKKGAKANA